MQHFSYVHPNIYIVTITCNIVDSIVTTTEVSAVRHTLGKALDVMMLTGRNTRTSIAPHSTKIQHHVAMCISNDV